MIEIFYYELMENDLAGKWIPIFKVGKVANRMVNGEQRNITKEELEQIYSNFKNKVLKNRDLPIVETHFGSETAYGWIKDLKIEGDYLYALIDWNEDGKKIIKDKKYRYLSPEILKGWIDEEGKEYSNVLFRVVLTNSPALNLPPLELNSMNLYAYSIVNSDDSNGEIEVIPVSAVDSEEEPEEKEEFAYTDEDREKLRKEAEARSKKYGIHIRSDGHLTPPSKYVETGAKSEDDYADPVNWRYPIHNKENALAGFKYFSKEANRSFYTPKERLIIWGRIIRALLKFGVKPTYDAKVHKDLPEDLKKKMEGYSMAEDFDLNIFVKDIINSVKETYDVTIENQKKEIDDLTLKIEQLTEKYTALEKEKMDKEWFGLIDELLEKGNILPSMVDELKTIPIDLRETIYSLLSKQKVINYDKESFISKTEIKDKEDEKLEETTQRINNKRGGK